MTQLVKSKKFIVLAAFVSVMSFSFVSTAQAGALSLNDIIGRLSNNRQEQNQNRGQNNSQNLIAPITRPTPTQQPTVTQQPAQTTVTPTSPAVPVEAQAPVQQTPVASRTTNRTPEVETPAVVKTLDTSAAVIQTANSQSVGESKTDGTPYVSNKIDPKVAEILLFAGIATITLGTLIYGSTLFLFNKSSVRHIPVKSL